MGDQVKRNAVAEEELKLRAWQNVMAQLPRGKAGVVLPPSPTDALRVPIIAPTEPETSKALTKLLMQLSPISSTIRTIRRDLPADLTLEAAQAGIARDDTNINGAFDYPKHEVFSNPNRPQQGQYDTMLHELMHSVLGRGALGMGSERAVQDYERRTGLNGRAAGWTMPQQFQLGKHK